MGRLKYRWKAVNIEGYGVASGFVVSCPVCGNEYNVNHVNSFRFCPECGRQLNDRKICTFDDRVRAEEGRKILNGCKSGQTV